MDTRPRPIWQLLIIMTEYSEYDSLTCDECFTLLEYLAGEAAKGADIEILQQAIRRHLEHCPGCREHHLARLLEMEEQNKWRKTR